MLTKSGRRKVKKLGKLMRKAVDVFKHMKQADFDEVKRQIKRRGWNWEISHALWMAIGFEEILKQDETKVRE